jgi:hypothetical protein
MKIAGKRHAELYQMVFDHGITHLLSPIFGADIMDRDDDYIDEMAMPGLERLVNDPDFTDFYDSHEVRVRFYGDYRKYLKPQLADLLESVTRRTKRYKKRFLYYGMFANDVTETVSDIAIKYYQKHGKAPKRKAVIKEYYGEQVPPVDLFIGFGKFAAFDMPLVATGYENLYFMTSPTPYLTGRGLRDILYDHLYCRQEEDEDYLALTQNDREHMRAYYHAGKDTTFGVGRKHPRWGFWVPESAENNHVKVDL